jgi:Set1/Ash2 histone methyltransferase complex subunit ASH2
VQSSKGAYEGTWYFEVSVDHLGETGHCRIGVATVKQEPEAPCGYSGASMAYRDVDGSKVHKAWREAYGKPFKEGDTIGCVISLSFTCLTGTRLPIAFRLLYGYV